MYSSLHALCIHGYMISNLHNWGSTWLGPYHVRQCVKVFIQAPCIAAHTPYVYILHCCYAECFIVTIGATSHLAIPGMDLFTDATGLTYDMSSLKVFIFGRGGDITLGTVRVLFCLAFYWEPGQGVWIKRQGDTVGGGNAHGGQWRRERCGGRGRIRGMGRVEGTDGEYILWSWQLDKMQRSKMLDNSVQLWVIRTVLSNYLDNRATYNASARYGRYDISVLTSVVGYQNWSDRVVNWVLKYCGSVLCGILWTMSVCSCPSV